MSYGDLLFGSSTMGIVARSCTTSSACKVIGRITSLVSLQHTNAIVLIQPLAPVPSVSGLKRLHCSIVVYFMHVKVIVVLHMQPDLLSAD